MNIKIISILLGFVFPAILMEQANAQQGFEVNGRLSNAANRMIYLADAGSKANRQLYSDSARANSSGKFSFSGTLTEPRLFTLKSKGSRFSRNFYVENSSVKVSGDADSLVYAQIEGSEEEDIRQKWLKANASVNKRDFLANLKILISEKPTSAFAADLIMHVIGTEGLILADSLLQIIEDSPGRKLTTVKEARTLLRNATMVKTGMYAPDFSQPDVSGKIISLSNFKGKYVLLDFWASWCIPCRAENATVLKAYKKYKEKNFSILAVSIDADRSAWLKAVKDDQLPWMQVADLKGKDNLAALLFAVKAIPTNFLIDPNGKIIAINLRGEELDKTLAQVL